MFDEPDPIAPYEVSEDEDGLATTEVKVTQPYGDPRGVPVFAYYSYKIMRPLVAYLQKRLVIADPTDALRAQLAKWRNEPVIDDRDCYDSVVDVLRAFAARHAG